MTNIEQPEPQFPDIPLWKTRRHRPGGRNAEFDRGRVAGRVVFINADMQEVPREEYEHWGGR